MHCCSASRCSCWPSGCGEHQIIEEPRVASARSSRSSAVI